MLVPEIAQDLQNEGCFRNCQQLGETYQAFLDDVFVRDMDPFTELYFLLQNPVRISYYKLIFSSYKNTKAVSLLFLCHLCLEIVLQDVYFRYTPQFHVSDSLSYLDTMF